MARTYRLQVPIKPETRKAIEEFADAMGISPAQAAAQLLEESAPGMIELAAAMRKANQSPSKALRDMANILHKATEQADQLSMELNPKPKRKAS